MVAPVIYAVVKIGATLLAPLIFTECDEAEQNSVGSPSGTTDTSGGRLQDAVSDVVSDVQAATDAAAESKNDTGPVDSFDTGPEMADSVTSAPQCPSFPLKGNVKLLGTLPCGGDYGFISDIDRIDDESGIGSCMDGSKSWLFTTFSGGIEDIQEIGYAADQLAPQDGVTYFTGFDANYAYGFGKIDPLNGNGINWKGLSPVTLADKTFAPTFSKGLLWHSGFLFVATSNVSWATGSPVYDPGTVLAYPDNGEAPKVLATGGVNATGIGLAMVQGKPQVVVVNSGDYNSKDAGNPHSYSSLLGINPNGPQVLPLLPLKPMRGLGVAGEISVVGARMALGSADNSAQVAIVDLENQDVRAVKTAGQQPTGLHLISIALLWPNGTQMLSGDFNTGQLQPWDISGATAVAVGAPIVLDKKLDDGAGLSDAVCLGGKLLVAKGKEIWSVE